MSDYPQDGVPPVDSDVTKPHPEPPHSARTIGPYRLLQLVGEGGMGDVWLAEQTTPVRRQVALKVIKAGMDSAQVVARFEAERQALALMDHPAIATVFDGGTTPEGRPYFVMEYVKGEPITTYCDRQRLTTAERLALFTQLCQGVQHAHQKGVIHRDLKPSNVLVTIQDNRPVPKIIDFGVAKATAQRLTERTLFTELGVMVGTPEYMSPEQAEMGGLDIDTRTDVYALGVVLYELLAGALPFDRTELMQAGWAGIQRIIREKEPQRPSTRVGPPGPASTEAAHKRRTEPIKLVSELRGDLDWITMKALEKDRTRRYASASDIAADIQRHLADQPVLAGPPSLAYTAKKFVHRHRAPVAAAVVVLVTLVAGLVGTTLMYVSASRANVRAEQRRAEAVQERAEAVRQNYVANIVAADSSLRMNEIPEAKRRLAACDPKLRNWEWRYLSHEVDSSLAVLRDAGDVPVRAWFAPDGSRILGLTDGTALPSASQSVLLKWDPAGRGSATRQDQEKADVVTADGERVTDGSRVLETSSRRVVCVLDWGRVPGVRKKLEDMVPRFAPGSPYGFADLDQAVAFNTDGTLLATGERGGFAVNPFISSGRFDPEPGEGAIRVWDARSGQLRTTLVGHRDSIWALAFSPDQGRLASGSEDGTARVWNLSSASTVAALNGHTAAVIAVAFSRDGTRLATGSRDRTVRVWNAATGALIQTMTGHGEPVTSVGFSPNGRTVVSGSADKTVRIWDAESGRETRCLFGHDAGVLSVAFGPDGDRIVSGSVDGTVRVWMPDAAGFLDRVVRAEDIRDLSYSRTGTVMVTHVIGSKEQIKTWDVSSGQRLAEIESPPGSPSISANVSVNGDGSKVVARRYQRMVDGNYGPPSVRRGLSAPSENSIRVFDARSGRQIAVSRTSEPGPTAVAWRPDSGRIAAVHDDRASITLLDASSLKPVVLLKGHTRDVQTLEYSPDGRMLASGDRKGTIRLWDDASGRALQVLEGQTGSVVSLAFSPDGASLASAAYDGTARIWNTHSGRLIAVLRGHDHKSVYSVSFSPDGSRLVTVAGDKTARVWDAKTGDQLLVLRYRKVGPRGAAFTPDGGRIVSWGRGNDSAEPRLVWSTK